MQVLSIDHVQLAMPAGREAEAIAFYEGLLGVPNIPKPATLADNGGCWFESPGLKIHLGVEADFRPARKAHPALLVDDVASLAQSVKAAGHDVVQDHALEQYERYFLTDPFGNRVEIMEPARGA